MRTNMHGLRGKVSVGWSECLNRVQAAEATSILYVHLGTNVDWVDFCLLKINPLICSHKLRERLVSGMMKTK